MPISNLSDADLSAFAENYRRAGKTEGGKYTLIEILMEERRRLPSFQSPRTITQRIVELAKISPDKRVSYGELWSSFNPDLKWEGHKTQKIVRDALARVIHYCVEKHLPIVTVLVVRQGPRTLTADAIQNIYDECKALGVDVGLDPVAFVTTETDRSQRLASGDLPAEDDHLR